MNDYWGTILDVPAETQISNDQFKTRLSGSGKPSILDNGMLSLEHTPAHLVHLVQQNAESLLLRLPPEIRNKIFRYVLAGLRVEVRAFMAAPRLYRVGPSNKCRSPSTNVSLLQVCRQIYNETATLVCSGETLFVATTFSDLKMLHNKLNVAQREALAILRISTPCMIQIDSLKIQLIGMFKGLKKVELCYWEGMVGLAERVKYEQHRGELEVIIAYR
ncbi:hypothetical protein P171DRAFT_497565 [Karstenula rhodostoma CBS 690.94]|uniref:Uncharacterized protein n=1 Tax=Karstenula rhodostoma CBS 690.94 TaxID=1392251 RepID=A0A9P4UB09_9PLEO|nr:hypothetical protein P171DRAFT_497565 [Karstenula rhodostoma CBS 690.94]